jgi:hypothetical protein
MVMPPESVNHQVFALPVPPPGNGMVLYSASAVAGKAIKMNSATTQHTSLCIALLFAAFRFGIVSLMHNDEGWKTTG